MTQAIVVEGLTKTYGGKTRALDGVDLQVPAGSVLSVLGPNGAGKTTLVRILATLLSADGGRAEVFGMDVAARADEVRSVIGLTGQFAAVDEYLTGFENLDMVGRLFGLGKKESRRRADELLDRFDLLAARDRTAKTYSGGMRRRLDIAASLIGHPKVLFLDEPTTGLDPRSRISMWDFISGLAGDGTTIFLTTQYLEEADRLADSIVVMDRGSIIAEGTADQLKAQVGGERLECVVTDPALLHTALELLAPLGIEGAGVDEQARRVSVPVAGGTEVLMEGLRRLDAAGVRVVDVGLRRPDLDDVFLTLTGHTAADESVTGEDPPDPGGTDEWRADEQSEVRA
ncbi:ATP-binding cassette domain-containing protein [Speluncibacter jeojiensis]|uniref:ATP-binding cassette domain-containing protein n=1 Tax=Speluncibacter jeojiensis TaxID=2710754 RepID=A0A9X4M493_9ACTN|nr:ATP-binding cassette domain-containing protein [Corynebacteriales bacterium D3-21]